MAKMLHQLAHSIQKHLYSKTCVFPVQVQMHSVQYKYNGRMKFSDTAKFRFTHIATSGHMLYKKFHVDTASYLCVLYTQRVFMYFRIASCIFSSYYHHT